jgi:hypothetical protein
MTLDHQNALEMHAAERYLLGELPAAETEAFELHYFECPQCALAVESGQMFISAARERFAASDRPGEVPQPKSSTSFLNSIAAFCFRPAFVLVATAALAAIGLYQGTVLIPALRQGRPLPTFTLIGVSRGIDPPVHVAGGTPFISLEADIPPEAHFRNYVCVISSGGNDVLRVVNPAPEDGHPIAILVPTRVLHNGEDVLTISGEGTDGQASDKISTYRFDFQIK